MPRFLIREGKARVLTAAAAEDLPTRWRGILALEDTVTGDDRVISAEALTWSEEWFPLPLEWAPVKGQGHDGALTIGTIDRLWREGSEVWGEGRLDHGLDEGLEVARRVHEGLAAFGPSVDLDRMDVEVHVLSSLLEDDVEVLMAPADPEEDSVAEGEVVVSPDGEERQIVYRWKAGDELQVVTSAELRGATLVSTPAFTGTTIEPVYSEEEEGEAEEREDLTEVVASMIAGASPKPLLEWFSDPELGKPTGLTIEGNRIYGHIALWDSCHTAYSQQCVAPPASSTGYAYFHTGEVLSDEGAVAVGRITVGTKHAARTLSATDTAAHYEHTGHCVAYVRAGEDSHGIWVAGTLNPRASEGQVEELRAHPPSGDWRRIGGTLELLSVLAVNAPGFPVPRVLVAGGHVQALQRTDLIEKDPAPDDRQALMDHLARKEAQRLARRLKEGIATDRAKRAAALRGRVGR